MDERENLIPRIRIRKRSVSIQDVADRAAVSIATVSRAVNKPHLVAAETATRVQHAIEELGYRPNRFAQGLMTQRSGLLGMALPDLRGEFDFEILRSADAEARRLGYQILVSALPPHGSPSSASALAGAFGLVEGVALMALESDNRVPPQLSDLRLPIVGVGVSFDGATDVLLVNHASGARAATIHLLSTTMPENCFYLGGPPHLVDSRERADAFSACLSAAGSPPRPDQVICNECSMAWGEHWANEVLPSRRDRTTAVLAATDQIAYGVVRTAQGLGMSIPEQVRIVGCDGSSLASIIRPTLSTVRVPRDELGRLAIRTLVARIEEPETPPLRVVLDTDLTVRESSALIA
ncbi:MAG: LacI family DNA-binding transcriptional regulator [Phycisphaeraceae bacterium]|nr:LacI family DNA-binding transcriptional regulator [Phycisphaeraceae bacterium]